LRPDGTRAREGEPVEPKPHLLAAALSTAARELLPDRPEEPDAEELRRREDFQATRRAWNKMGREHGIYVGGA
jgi:hypothetical protein